MFIMKSELLISLLYITFSISTAVVVPVEDIVPKEAVPGPVGAVAVISEEKAELSIPERSASNCPQGWQPYEDCCYLLVNISYSRINAEFLCENLNSSLASIHNIWEYSFLQQLAWKAGFLTAWIGGYRFQGYWRWDDGTTFNYNNWFSYDSNSYDACIYLNSEGVKGWSNDQCTNVHPFICSFKLTC